MAAVEEIQLSRGPSGSDTEDTTLLTHRHVTRERPGGGLSPADQCGTCLYRHCSVCLSVSVCLYKLGKVSSIQVSVFML